MAVQHFFDFDDRDIFRAADDDVLTAAADADVAVFLHLSQIAGFEPTVWIGCEKFRFLKIADEITHPTCL